jgi:hypothetical protein
VFGFYSKRQRFIHSLSNIGTIDQKYQPKVIENMEKRKRKIIQSP